MKMIPARRTAISVEPLSTEKQVDLLLDGLQRHRAELLRQVVEECGRDAGFLDRTLKALRPLRSRGRVAPAYQKAAVAGICGALAGSRPGEIVETIAYTLNISPAQARRLRATVRRS
jgi:hypothetical protein